MLRAKRKLTNYLGNHYINYLSPNVVTSNILPVLKVDSGASKTYLKPEHKKFLTEVRNLNNGPRATLPDNTLIQASATGNLPLHSDLALQSLVYPKLTSESLLSVGQLCDEGCFVLFHKQGLLIFKNNQLVLSGTRNKNDGLYDVPFPEQKMNFIITRDKSKTDLAQFLHGCAFLPAISTFQTSINKGNFITWPGISQLHLKKLIGTPMVTNLGHLDQERKNVQSTKDAAIYDDFSHHKFR